MDGCVVSFTASLEAEAGPEGEAFPFFLNSWLLRLGQASVALGPQQKEGAEMQRLLLHGFPSAPEIESQTSDLHSPPCKPLDHTAR